MGRNASASPNLHRVAFFPSRPRGIFDCMERKPTYIKEWRRKRGYTQREVVGRLAVLEVAMTEASLSRIENGKQPYSQDTLEAIATALDLEPGQLLDHNPFKEGAVIDFLRHLDAKQAEQAEAVLRAMFTAAI